MGRDEASTPVGEFCAALKQLRMTSRTDPVALMRRLGISRAQFYAILNGGIKRPPDWATFVRPFVDICTRSDAVALAQWRQRHDVLVGVCEALRRQERRARQAQRDPGAPPLSAPGQPEAGPLALPIPAAAPLALAQLPAQLAGFTGRDRELDSLAALLDPASSAGMVTALAGLAGVGKTTLAVQAGHAAGAEWVVSGWSAVHRPARVRRSAR